MKLEPLDFVKQHLIKGEINPYTLEYTLSTLQKNQLCIFLHELFPATPVS